MQDYLQVLNPPQREAVCCTEGPLLILAGAGTGKTRALTARIAHILTQGLARPHEIMAVTFTNKAAKEMHERIEGLVGASAFGLWMGTFHALGARLLRENAELVGLDRRFTIIDTDDQQRVCKELIVAANLDEKRWPARLLVHTISRWKDNAWLPEDVPHDEAQSFNGKAVDLYRKYQKRLQENNACDFGDLLLKTFVMLKKNEDILTHYQSLFKYVLVDEYQDTNAVQYLLIRLLVMKHKNVCVVGDDDQSIYAWRGAEVGNILKFERDFPGAKVIKLEQNYRSTGHILKAAGGLIAHNDNRHDKTLWTEEESGEKIEVHPVAGDKDESRMIADRIEQEVSSGLTYDHMAVLLRTAAQTRSIEERFIKSGIPYTIVGGLRFYERKEIRDALAYLRLLSSEKDSLAFERIINVPRRGVGDSALQEVKRFALDANVPMYVALKDAATNGLLTSRAKGKLAEFVNTIELLRTRMEETTPDRLVEEILEQTGYFTMLKEDKNKEDAKGRLDNLKELIRAMQEYEDVPTFLEHVSLVMDNEQASQTSVKVTTVHSAKGLEFDTVFVPGFEEGLFPHQRSLDEEGEKGLEEERRLAYVAITRAKRLVVLSYCSSRFMYGQFQGCVASRFLMEIPQESLDIMPAMQNVQTWRAGSGSRYNQKNKYRTPLFKQKKDAVPDVTPVSAGGPYEIGVRVFHQKFGYGRVKRQSGKGDNQRLTIAFDKAGEKQLVASMAKLEIV